MSPEPASTESKPRLIGVMAVVFRGNRILLIRNRKRGSRVEVPCGKVDPGETPQEAVARELWEETHMAALESTPLWVKDMGHYQIQVFLVRVSEEEQPKGGDDALEAWFGELRELETGSHPEDLSWLAPLLGGNS